VSRTKRRIHPRDWQRWGGPDAEPRDRKYLDKLQRGHRVQSSVADDVVIDGDLCKKSWRDCHSPGGKRYGKKLVRRARRRTEFASYEAGEIDGGRESTQDFQVEQDILDYEGVAMTDALDAEQAEYDRQFRAESIRYCMGRFGEPCDME